MVSLDQPQVSNNHYRYIVEENSSKFKFQLKIMWLKMILFYPFEICLGLGPNYITALFLDNPQHFDNMISEQRSKIYNIQDNFASWLIFKGALQLNLFFQQNGYHHMAHFGNDFLTLPSFTSNSILLYKHLDI
jgi:hypothetical protein